MKIQVQLDLWRPIIVIDGHTASFSDLVDHWGEEVGRHYYLKLEVEKVRTRSSRRWSQSRYRAIPSSRCR